MKKFTTLLLALLLAAAVVPMTALPVFAASNISTNIDITFNDKSIALRPDMTGLGSYLLFSKVEITASPSDEVYVQTERGTSCIMKKENGQYVWIYTSQDLLEEGGEYYYMFTVQEKRGYEWDLDATYTFTVNGKPADDAYMSIKSKDGEFRVYLKTSCSWDNDYVSSVSFDPGNAMVQKGTSYQCSPTVVGTVDSFNWYLIGNHLSGTSLSDTGVLTVAKNETNNSVTVRAESVFNPSAYADLTVEFTSDPVYISSVSVVPESVSVYKGMSYTFTAEVVGTDYHDVEWSLYGNENNLTSINPKSGSLNVTRNETAQTLTVRATSLRDPSKYDEAVVTVLPRPLITNVAINYDIFEVCLTPDSTGMSVSTALVNNFTYSPGEEALYILHDIYLTGLCKKEADGSYTMIGGNTDALDPSGEYYFRFFMYPDKEYDFDVTKLPNVTVNGVAADEVAWVASEPRPMGDVYAYIRVYMDGTDGISVKAMPENKLGSAYTVNGRDITVRYDQPLKLGYKSGDVIAELTASSNGDGSYTYTVPEGVNVVALVVKGDATGDGAVNLGDSARIKAAFRRKTDLSGINAFAADVTGDGAVNLGDAAKITAVFRKKTTIDW